MSRLWTTPGLIAQRGCTAHVGDCRRPNKNITAERLLLNELFSKFQPFSFFQTKIVLLYCHTLLEDALRMFLINMILLRPPARVKAAVKGLGWWGYETLGGMAILWQLFSSQVVRTRGPMDEAL